MRLFLITNVSRDPQYASRRRANPLYVTKSPEIKGHRLFPRATLNIPESELTPQDIDSLECLIKAGVITVSVLGGAVHIQKINDSVDSIQEEPQEELSIVEELPPAEKEEEPVEIPEEPSPVQVDDLVEEEVEESSQYTEEDLSKMLNSELRELLSILDPDFSSAGVKKSILIERILEKQ